MKMKTQLVGAGLAAFGALSLCAGAATAGSITYPGELVGLALGAPLPEGLYFVDTGTYGNDRGVAYNSNIFVNIPVIAWSTPWTFLGGRIYGYVAVPSLAVSASNVIPPTFLTPFGTSVSVSGIYNPALLVGEAWDLGNNFGFGVTVGGYAPISNSIEQNFWTFNVRPSLSYTGDGWNVTANVVVGITGNNNGFNAGPQIAPGGFLFSRGGLRTSPDYINVDLNATKKFDKWEIGAVAFGSADLNSISTTPLAPFYAKQSQIAVGALVGYNFGPIDIQAYVTRDVYTHNYFNAFGDKVYETNIFVRGVMPLWNPPAPPPPVVAKY
jgi:Putative MetA-pathway of phenol degradation